MGASIQIPGEATRDQDGLGPVHASEHKVFEGRYLQFADEAHAKIANQDLCAVPEVSES